MLISGSVRISTLLFLVVALVDGALFAQSSSNSPPAASNARWSRLTNTTWRVIRTEINLNDRVLVRKVLVDQFNPRHLLTLINRREICCEGYVVRIKHLVPEQKAVGFSIERWGGRDRRLDNNAFRVSRIAPPDATKTEMVAKQKEEWEWVSDLGADGMYWFKPGLISDYLPVTSNRLVDKIKK